MVYVKKNRIGWKRALAVMLCSFIVWSAGDTAFAAETNVFQPVPHGSVHFEEMRYTRPDLEKFDQYAKKIEALCGNASNAEEVLALYDQMLDLYAEVDNASALINIYIYQDGENQAYADEAAYLQKEGLRANELLINTAQRILDSECGTLAREVFGGEFSEAAAKLIEGDDKQKALFEREDQLIRAYNEASLQEFQVTVNGTAFTESQLYGSELDNTEYLAANKKLKVEKNKVLGEIYLQMVKVRDQIAKSYGYANYAEFSYEREYRRDYSTEDAQVFCQSVKKYIVPLVKSLDQICSVSNSGQSYSPDEIIEMIGAHTEELSSEVEEAFRYMVEYHLYDIEERKGKLAVGFTTMIPKYNAPFLFNRPELTRQDVKSVIHELGHYNCAYWNPSFAWYNYDVAEIHAQGMELLFLEYYDELFGEDAKAEALNTIAQIADSMIQGCLYDEFQRKVYENPNLSLAEINAIFGKLLKDYGVDSLWTPEESWVDVPHNFQTPMYYISYATSAAPALEIWLNSIKDYRGAVLQYLELAALGEDVEFLDALGKSGLSSPFQEKQIKSLAESIAAAVQITLPKNSQDFNDQEFQPDGVMTRGMLVTVLAKFTFGSSEEEELQRSRETNGSSFFRDVKESDWYAPYVEWAAASGIVSGTGNQRFDPNAPVDREQLAAILSRYLDYYGFNLPEKNTQTSFADAGQISSWAVEAVQKVQAVGVLSGNPDGSFHPKSIATRAETAQVLYGLLEIAAE